LLSSCGRTRRMTLDLPGMTPLDLKSRWRVMSAKSGVGVGGREINEFDCLRP